ncbi:Uncharacterised protein [Mycobacterium tuberculosis]|nr:Uncharacterised protein [Mycobacterium tuberculosis]COW89346.1 Uncharacterised protein [Mycobacterium tuberculosis]COX27475.1 Uncharacterised protein [Mycobacterium tuberculosis]COZ89253.1 Uncharacterised protein [Mycobacterium tuberculosis]CPA16133.1 Uncharacterised protein [Mycobacterium tuberculosis]
MVSKLGSVTSSALRSPLTALSISTLSAGTTEPRSRFHFPTPSSPKRNPSEPCGTTTVFVSSSSRAGLNAAFSLSSPMSAAVKNFPGTSRSPRFSNLIKNGRSV